MAAQPLAGSLVERRDNQFRTSVRRVSSVRDFHNHTHVWTIYLDITWDPELTALFIDAQPEGLIVKDQRGEVLKPISAGAGRVPVNRKSSVEMPIRVQAPAQPVEKISLLKGVYTILGSKKTHDFTFDLGKSNQTNQTKEDVTVSLKEFKQAQNAWTFRIGLKYPADTPEFESFESWLANNEIVLERKDGKARFTPNGGYSIDDSSGKAAVLTYRFIEDKNLKLSPHSEWQLVYRTLGKLEKLPVQFELTDLLAP